MSWTNQDTHQSTVQAHNGTTSLYYDGTSPANNTDQPMFTIDNIDFTSDFTVEFFCYADAGGLSSPVTITGRDATKYIIFWPAGGTTYLQWFKPSDDGVIFKNYSVSPTMIGRWVHMAMSYDSVTDTVHFATDGVVNSYTEGLSTVFMTGSNVAQADFMIWPQSQASRMFNGYVDDFRVTQSALYTAAYTVPDPIVDSWAVGGTTLYYEDMEPPTVTWVQNGSSQYEVSSKNHLLNLMTQGALYSDLGTPPSSYWSDSFIQTVDIDLENDSNITPIGGATRFTGIYDGDSYSISNWTYSTAGQYIGLFGATNTGCTLRNIKLAGVWNLDVDFTGHGGFLCGFLENSFAYNCEGDFDVGTYQGVTTSNWVQGGTMIGQAKTSTLQGFTVKGSVDIDPATTNNKGHGGVFGATEKCYVKFVQNLANFPSGIKNQYRTAGICAFCEQDYEWSHVLNAMTGDIWAATSAGIFGYIRLGTGANTTIDSIILSMTGDIFNQSGGVNGAGFCHTLTTAFEPIILTGFVNYMTGDTYSATIRTASGANDLTIQDSIIAPNGTFLTVDTGTNSTTGTFSETTKYDDTFGLAFTTNNGGSSTSATLSTAAYLTHSSFSLLPYMDLSGTDDDGNSYDWDFVYGNLAGNATEYPLYTHAILHKDDVSSPFVIDYDTVGSGFDGTTLQVTFANYGTSTIYVNVNFTVNSTTATTTVTFTPPAPITVTPNPLSILVTLEDAGAVNYKITYTPDGGSETVFIDSSTDLVHTIDNLLPETNYTVSLFIDNVFEASVTTTTLANSAANYNSSDFDDGSGVFDITSFDEDSRALFSEIMNDIFSTGDEVALSLSSGKTVSATFVNRGGTVSIEDAKAVVLPFDAGAGDSQEATFTLTDTSTEAVDYDETSESITIDGVEYFVGDVFVLDGKKVTVSFF